MTFVFVEGASGARARASVHVCVGVGIGGAHTSWSMLTSAPPQCVSAKAGLADCDWRREPLRLGEMGEGWGV